MLYFAYIKQFNGKAMTIKEGRELIEILKKENEENTTEERDFNIEWIMLLNESILNALSKRK